MQIRSDQLNDGNIYDNVDYGRVYDFNDNDVDDYNSAFGQISGTSTTPSGDPLPKDASSRTQIRQQLGRLCSRM